MSSFNEVSAFTLLKGNPVEFVKYPLSSDSIRKVQFLFKFFKFQLSIYTLLPQCNPTCLFLANCNSCDLGIGWYSLTFPSDITSDNYREYIPKEVALIPVTTCLRWEACVDFSFVLLARTIGSSVYKKSTTFHLVILFRIRKFKNWLWLGGYVLILCRQPIKLLISLFARTNSPSERQT
jgi:hypothetical protein